MNPKQCLSNVLTSNSSDTRWIIYDINEKGRHKKGRYTINKFELFMIFTTAERK